MSSTRTILDPTSERNVAERERLARPASLEGLTVGLLDISKPRGDVFLDQLETRLVGVGVFVASEGFVEAAEAQSTSLGFASVARVFTPHPIQDRTDDEMRAYADAAFDEILDSI